MERKGVLSQRCPAEVWRGMNDEVFQPRDGSSLSPLYSYITTAIVSIPHSLRSPMTPLSMTNAPLCTGSLGRSLEGCVFDEERHDSRGFMEYGTAVKYVVLFVLTHFWLFGTSCKSTYHNSFSPGVGHLLRRCDKQLFRVGIVRVHKVILCMDHRSEVECSL